MPFLATDERRVLELRVGAPQRRPQSVRRIAQRLDMSVDQVLALERRAVQGLRAAMRATDCEGRAAGATRAAADGRGPGLVATVAPTPLSGLGIVATARGSGADRGARLSGHRHRSRPTTGANGTARGTSERRESRAPAFLEPLTGGPGRLTLMLLVAGAFIVGVSVGERRRRS
jgi:hypothetical protein